MVINMKNFNNNQECIQMTMEEAVQEVEKINKEFENIEFAKEQIKYYLEEVEILENLYKKYHEFDQLSIDEKCALGSAIRKKIECDKENIEWYETTYINKNRKETVFYD